MNHRLRSSGPNPYGWMCYCLNCGKTFADYKNYKNCPGKKLDKKAMKKQTKAQKFDDLANAYHQMRKGEPVRRIGRKDGSIRTCSVVLVDPKKLEHEVLADCLAWLKKHHVFCNRHDSGSFQNDRGQWGTYGIKGSGDIHGMFKRHAGRHFEVECKRGSGGTLSIGQQKRMKRVCDNGGLYFVVHGPEELEHFMGEFV